jgi:hypothetical protein
MAASTTTRRPPFPALLQISSRSRVSKLYSTHSQLYSSSTTAGVGVISVIALI